MMGIAWYRPDQWSLLRAIASDPHQLEPTYEEWVAMATKAMRDLAERGVHTVKVDVEVRKLAAWCEERHRPIDGASRATFVAEWLQKNGASTLQRKSQGDAE
jgi:hypothetical protein